MRMYYKTLSSFIIATDAVNDSCGLKYMTLLKDLTVIVISNTHIKDTLAVLQMCNMNLKSICFTQFEFQEENFNILMKSLNGKQIETFICKGGYVTVKQIEIMLTEWPNLKFCIVNLHPSENKKHIAKYVNDLVGKVNFGLGILELIPKSLLNYNIDAYRVACPQGKMKKK